MVMKRKLWKWASHAPLISGVLDLYAPKLVLELGCGMYSTPLFQSCNIEYKGFENDLEWVGVIKDKLKVNVIYHDIGDITIEMEWDKLTEIQKIRLITYYKELAKSDFVLQNKFPKLLFVDGFTATRRKAIDLIKDKFDIVI